MCEELSLLAHSFKKYIQNRTGFELFSSFLAWAFLIIGAAGRHVFLDKFRRSTTTSVSEADPFAMEFVSDLFVFAFFLIAFIIYVSWKCPDLYYLRHKRGIACILIAAVGTATAFYLQGYSSPHVDPALRHISTLVLVVLTSAIAWVMRAGPGHGHCNAAHIPVFAFCIGGVLLAGAGSLKRIPDTMASSDDKSWFSIYIFSYVPQAIALVAVTYYFKRYLIFREQDVRNTNENDGIFVSIGNHTSDLASPDDDNDDRFDYKAQKRTDPLTGKVVFAFLMVMCQLIFTLLLGPTDIAPFIGSSQNVTQGLDRFRDTFSCVFAPTADPCNGAWRPFVELTLSTVFCVVGMMFALQRTPFGAAQAIVMGSTSLGEFLRSSFPSELADPGAKMGTTSVGESVGAVVLSLVAVILTFVAEESAELENVPRRSALNAGESSSNVNAAGRGAGEKAPLVDYGGYDYSSGASPY